MPLSEVGGFPRDWAFSENSSPKHVYSHEKKLYYGYLPHDSKHSRAKFVQKPFTSMNSEIVKT